MSQAAKKTSIGVLVLVVISLTFYNLVKAITPPKKVVAGEKTNLEEEKSYWEDMVYKYPTYKQAWEELSKVEEKLGNTKEANEASTTARNISPNSF